VPNLTTLVLTANNFTELADLDVLATFRQLAHLVLLENPVTRKEVRSSFLYPGSDSVWDRERLMMGLEERRLTGPRVALSVLGYLEVSECPVLGL
jgi:hypothetical protein